MLNNCFKFLFTNNREILDVKANTPISGIIGESKYLVICSNNAIGRILNW